MVMLCLFFEYTSFITYIELSRTDKWQNPRSFSAKQKHLKEFLAKIVFSSTFSLLKHKCVSVAFLLNFLKDVGTQFQLFWATLTIRTSSFSHFFLQPSATTPSGKVPSIQKKPWIKESLLYFVISFEVFFFSFMLLNQVLWEDHENTGLILTIQSVLKAYHALNVYNVHTSVQSSLINSCFPHWN